MENTQSKKLSLDNYIQGICPVCKSDDVDYVKTFVDDGGLSERVDCNSCKARWYENFEIVSIEMED